LTYINTRLELVIYSNSGPRKAPLIHSQTIKLKDFFGGQGINVTPKTSHESVKFAYFDANRDGYLDLYVGTNLKTDSAAPAFLGDFILYGPEFEESLWLGEAKTGTGHVKAYDPESVVVARAGQNWAGEVALIRPISPSNVDP